MTISLTPASAFQTFEGLSTAVHPGTFSDTTPAGGPWVVKIDWGDATPAQSSTLNLAGTIPDTSHVFADNGSYTMTETVTSASGASITKTTQATVANVAPTVAVMQGPFAANVSDVLSLSARATDPSTVDTAAGFTYSWDFGDGSPRTIGLNLSTVSHIYKMTGSFTVSVTATDKDGGVSPTVNTIVNASTLPIPEMARWQSQMLTYGAKAATSIAQPHAYATVDPLLDFTYYDAERVYYQIADYTKDSTWPTASQNAEVIYRDRYLLPNNGGLPGYWIFAQGLAMDYQKTGDTTSLNAVMSLSQNAAYASDYTDPTYTVDVSKSREVAYNIESLITAEQLGAPHRARLDLLVNQALGHIDQWFVSKTAPFFQPFMVGLTAEALIKWYDKTGDPRVLPALKTAMDGMWNTTWDANSRSFLYVSKQSSEGSPTPAPDLNLLIAPAFAWIYRMTGDVTYRDRGDLAFAGGVDGSYLDGVKQFNQNYRWSFDFVKWRSQAPLTSSNPVNPVTVSVVDGQSTAEGATFAANLGTFSDSLGNDSPWSISINWGDGSAATNFSANTTGTIPSKSHVFADNGSYSMTESITSASGASSAKTTQVTVANVAPTVSPPQGPFAATVSNALTLSATASDPSPIDTAAGFTYTWDFGDGSPRTIGLNLSTVSHVYKSIGTFTVSVTATDKDGGVSPTAAIIVNVANATILPIPGLALWEAQMLTAGRTTATALAANPSMVLTGYDPAWVYDQIAAYTGDNSWLNSARIALNYYRDSYVLPNYGGVAGSLNFGKGLEADFVASGNVNSQLALSELVQKAAYASIYTPSASTQDESRSGEVALGILTLMSASDVGVGNSARLSVLVGQALGDLDQWFGSKTALGFSPDRVGLILQALTQYAETSGDGRVLPAVKNAVDWLWNNAWSTVDQGFRPINRSTNSLLPAADWANLMVAPAFAWVYKQTGDATYRDRGDQVFAGGVNNSNLGSSSALVFDLNYAWSFDYVKWRRQAPLV